MLEKSLESPLDLKEIQPVNPMGNQSWIFFGKTDAEAETPILCYLMWRADSLEKTLMLGKIEDKIITGQPRMRWLDSITTQCIWIWANSDSYWRTEKPGVLKPMGSHRVGHNLATEQGQIILKSVQQLKQTKKTHTHPQRAKIIMRTELVISQSLTSDYTTKLHWSVHYGTSTKQTHRSM